MCSDKHITIVARAAGKAAYPEHSENEMRANFEILKMANMESLAARYGDEIGTDLSGFGPASTLPLPQQYMAIRSYCYQSCEHGGWASSAAKQLADVAMESVAYSIISEMDGAREGWSV